MSIARFTPSPIRSISQIARTLYLGGNISSAGTLLTTRIPSALVLLAVLYVLSTFIASDTASKIIYLSG
jgi:hypothetical protein